MQTNISLAVDRGLAIINTSSAWTGFFRSMTETYAFGSPGNCGTRITLPLLLQSVIAVIWISKSEKKRYAT